MTELADPLLWLVDSTEVDAPTLARFEAWLGPSEAARCARFVRAERRRQYIVGRALLRLALGRLLGSAPRAIALTERPGHAPAFAFPPGIDGGYSISHSGAWVACAASLRTRLGLDIERIDRERDVLALAQQAFGASEMAALQACAPEEQHAVFYRQWCAHEARIKLGAAGAAEYSLGMPGLAGAIATTVPLIAAPRLVQVTLDQW